jgi:hypothetical protein
VRYAVTMESMSAGDLVVVRLAGMERLAVLCDVDGTVRVWRRDLGRFERDTVLVRPTAILRLAPEDATTAAARAALAGA